MSYIQRLIENSKTNEDIARKLFGIEILACQSSTELLQRLLDLIKVKLQLSGIYLLPAEPISLSYLINSNLQLHWHQKNTKQISIEKLTVLQQNNKPLLIN